MGRYGGIERFLGSEWKAPSRKFAGPPSSRRDKLKCRLPAHHEISSGLFAFLLKDFNPETTVE